MMKQVKRMLCLLLGLMLCLSLLPAAPAHADAFSHSLRCSETVFRYDGKAHAPELTVTDGNGNVLTAGKDYYVDYIFIPPDGSGQRQVTECIEIGDYVGRCVLNSDRDGMLLFGFDILGDNDVWWCEVSLSESSFLYDGNNHRPTVTVRDAEGKLLKEGTDYTLAYEREDSDGWSRVTECVEPGEYMAVVNGIGSYTGSTDLRFDMKRWELQFSIISSCDLSLATVELSPSVFYYNGKDQRPAVTVKDAGGKTLTRGVDYSLEYYGIYKDLVIGVAECAEARRYMVRAVGKGDYTGKTDFCYFEIIAVNDLGNGTVTLSETELPYDGTDQKPAVTVQDASGKTLTEGVDYTLVYEDSNRDPVTACVEIGSYCVYAVGMGDYSGETASEWYKIVPPAALNEGTLTLSEKEFTYDGKDHKPAVTVQDAYGRTLTEGVDYFLEYEDENYDFVEECVAAGNYMVIAVGMGGYSGYLFDEFEIVKKSARVPGDVNGDGVVNGKDVTRLCRALAGYSVEISESNADVNADGKVNGKDLTRLCRFLAGYAVELK